MLEDLNLVLLGKIGAGKSASGNTILGQEEFESKESFSLVTQNIAFRTGTQFNQRVTVYDTPGLFNAKLSGDEIQRMRELFWKCESDFCVFLLIISTDRFTEKERQIVERIEELLGEKRLKKTWILFTRGDELEEENMTIDDFICENEQLMRLVNKYNQRHHVFNNVEKEKTKKTNQVQELLRKINKISPKTSMKPMITNFFNQYFRHLGINRSPRRIVLLGQTGVGKSAAGNTILGQKESRSAVRMKSATSNCLYDRAAVSGRSVSVVDTPGFFHTEMKHEEIITEIVKSVYLSSPGPHAFLIVFPVNVRYTEHEQQIPQMIEMMFGEEVLKYSIILFTHGDLLEGESVEELIKQNSRLRRLVYHCGGRFQVFNNRAENNRQQVNGLLHKIDSMVEQNGERHYSHQMYEDAQRFRREEERRQREEEERRQREKEERRQREEEEKKQQEEEQRQVEIERVIKETEKRIRAEFEGPPRLMQRRLIRQREKKRKDQRRELEQRLKVYEDLCEDHLN